jgi:hypothetical protein
LGAVHDTVQNQCGVRRVGDPAVRRAEIRTEARGDLAGPLSQRCSGRADPARRTRFAASEAARILGSTEESVTSALKRARATLRHGDARPAEPPAAAGELRLTFDGLDDPLVLLVRQAARIGWVIAARVIAQLQVKLGKSSVNVGQERRCQQVHTEGHR